MAEMILPGTYIEVRAEGLIVPGRVTVGNIGIVGTASKGPVGQATFIGSYVEARQRFGDYDAWLDGDSGELTLVRALELAYSHGATTVIAVRVASASKAAATYVLRSASGPAVSLAAKTEGTWGNGLQVNVSPADVAALIEDEEHAGSGTVSLDHTPVLKSARNRIHLFTAGDGLTRSMAIIYDDVADAPTASQVKINRTTGDLSFGLALDPADRVTATYSVDPASATKVTLRLGTSLETYTVVNGDDLVDDINKTPGGSAWVTAAALANSAEILTTSATVTDFANFGTGTNTAGANGENASDSDYAGGLNVLLNEPAHIILAAGKDDSFGDELNGHCQSASTDALRRERIAVVGSALGATLDTLRGHNLDSDRLIYVAPGVTANDAASGEEVVLPGAYAAAAIAGMLSSFSPHISLTNKTLSVGALEFRYTSTELTQLVLSRILALEARQGFRIVKGITTSTNTAWHQITTRRIVDYAKFGVRSAANPYIGLLNNERVRGALQTTIASFLNEMVRDEMLISYDLSVTATREEERQGIVNVTMVLRPVFSIDFIKVTMFLE
jgi:hypothetical protein